MDISTIMKALTTWRRRCRANIPINTSVTMNALTMQRCKRCTFDSPGLASESEVYPGSFDMSGNNAVGVVPFIPRLFIVAFYAENVQHLRRWPPHYIHNPGLADANPGLSKVQRLQRWTTNALYTILLYMINYVISYDNLRQMVVWFAVFYAMICPKSFHH